MPFLIATAATQERTIPIYHQNVSPAIRKIIMPLPTPVIWLRTSPLIVWNAIPPCLDGNRPISQYMMLSFFPYTQESTIMNGALVPTAIAIRQTILYSPASIAMSTTVQKWMTNIRMKLIMNIPVWHVWIAIPGGVTNRVKRGDIYYLPFSLLLQR